MIYTQVSIRQLKQIHAATHPARLAPTNSPAHTGEPAESARADLLSTLEVEAETEEDNEVENRL